MLIVQYNLLILVCLSLDYSKQLELEQQGHISRTIAVGNSFGTSYNNNNNININISTTTTTTTTKITKTKTKTAAAATTTTTKWPTSGFMSLTVNLSRINMIKKMRYWNPSRPNRMRLVKSSRIRKAPERPATTP